MPDLRNMVVDPLSHNTVLATTEKEKGNTHYRKKEFQEALGCYDKALQYDPTNITFYSNKAAVYLEQGEFDKCREECLLAVVIGRKNGAEPNLIAKAMARHGSSYFRQKDYENAKHYYLQSLDENYTRDVAEKIKLCDREIEEQKKMAYVNPDIATAEKLLGDQFLEKEDFESALEHYIEAIKRNPSDPKLFLCKAIVLVKLSRQEEAVLDCEKCLEMDPSAINAYLCKGATLESLGQFDSAMDSYEKALSQDPNNRKAQKAYYRCLDKDYRQRNDSSCVLSRASEHPQLSEALSNIDLNSLHSKDSLQKTVSDHSTDIMTLLEYGVIEIEN